jgi:hypothetical protein
MNPKQYQSKIATMLGLIALTYGQAANAATYKFDQLTATKSPAAQTPDDFSSFAYPSLGEDGTIAFAAANKGTNVITPETPSFRPGTARNYVNGIYKRLPNGQIKAVKTQDNSSIRQNYKPGTTGYGESRRICNFLPPSLSGNNVAFTANCEFYDFSTFSPRSSSAQTSTLAAEINGQLRERIATGNIAQFTFKPFPSVPSIAGSAIVYEIENKIVLDNGSQSAGLGIGRDPKITQNGNVLFQSGFSLSLRRNGIVEILKTPYNQPSPDGVGTLNQSCGFALYQSQVVYCIQSSGVISGGTAYRAIYQQQGDKAFKMIDNTYRLKPQDRLLGSFSDIATSNQAIAFVEGARTTGLQTLFVREGNGALTKIIAEADRLDGKKVTKFSVGSRYLQNKTVVFAVTFEDGSQAIYRARPV